MCSLFLKKVDGILTNYHENLQEEESYEYAESESDEEDESGIPAGHDPEDYEVDDAPSWES